MLYALIALCLFGGASAQLLGFLGCPSSVNPMDGFNARSLKGRWYAVRKYPMVYTWLSHCPWAEFESTSATNLRIKYGTYYTKQRVQLRFGSELAPHGGGKTSELDSTLILKQWKMAYTVLATDYNKYLVVYSCTSLVLFHIKFVFIFTKEPYPSTSVTNNAEAVLVRNKLSTEYLQTVIRDNCSAVD